MFFVFAGLALAGEVAHKFADWEFGSTLCLISAIFCSAFGGILLRENLLEQRRMIKSGPEQLPPVKDVASVLVDGRAIAEHKKNTLLKAISKAKKASCSGSVAKEIPFQIVDHWGGTWELKAYEETGGKRGFSINRIFYSGAKAEIVAECVGLYRSPMPGMR